MAALRKRNAVERRLREIEREKTDVRAQLEEVRRWADDVPDAAQMLKEPRLREAAIPDGYRRSDGAFASLGGVRAGVGVVKREADEAPDAPLTIAETKVDIPESSVSDAVMKLDLRNTTALLFKNSRTGSLNMVYRREDGNIGWVEPRA